MDTSKYIYALLIFVVLTLGTCQAQFFKYATFYTSISMNTSMVENQDFIAINKNMKKLHKLTHTIITSLLGFVKSVGLILNRKNGLGIRELMSKALGIILLLVILLVGSIYLITLLSVIGLKNLLIRTFGLDI